MTGVPLGVRREDGTQRPPADGRAPQRTPTFLATDIEGSTRRWERDATAMAGLLAWHDRVLREAIERNGGRVLKTVGDAFYAVFSEPEPAVRTALDAQLLLVGQGGEQASEPLRVRMAVHAGPVHARDGDFFGPTMNRLARILSSAHGGQTLLSAAAVEAVRACLPAGTGLRDLGVHQLKDLDRSEHLYQLLHPGLPAEFPALRTLGGMPNNLPAQITSFVGRQGELSEVLALLERHRLVTLTGAGGSGKTRLALAAGAQLLRTCPDGVWLVEYAPVSDLDLVAQRVATAIGLREEGGRPVLETLVDYLRDRDLVLVLDNCEHLLPACAELARTLIARAPRLRLLVTSREPLDLPGETVFVVPPLRYTQEPGLPTEMLEEYEAARLFVERARAVDPSFALTAGTASSVAQIVARLDGIPLAIELAAARLRILSAEQIAQRLDNRLALLTDGARGALPQQRTLRATLDWSYDLLKVRERLLLERLAVFAGGWTLDAAEDIVSGRALRREDVLDLLGKLVDKSLVVVQQNGSGRRYRMLGTIREYAREKLADSGEQNALLESHAGWYLARAEAASRTERIGRQPSLVWVAGEQDNYRAAQDWALQTGDAELAARFARALFWYWLVRAQWHEGAERARAALSLESGVPDAARASTLAATAALLYRQGRHDEARPYGAEALELAEQVGDPQALADALFVTAQLLIPDGEWERAADLAARGVEFATRAGNRWSLPVSLLVLGRLALVSGDVARGAELHRVALARFLELGERWWGVALARLGLGAVALLENRPEGDALIQEALATAREVGATAEIGGALMLRAFGLAQQGDLARGDELLAEGWALIRDRRDWTGRQYLRWVARLFAENLGDLGRAQRLLQDDADLARTIGDPRDVAESIANVARIAALRGEVRPATALQQEALALRRAHGHARDVADSLLDVAALQAEGRPGLSTSLLGAVEALFETHRLRPRRGKESMFRLLADTLHRRIGDGAFNSAWDTGRHLSLDQAVVLAQAGLRSSGTGRSTRPRRRQRPPSTGESRGSPDAPLGLPTLE